MAEPKKGYPKRVPIPEDPFKKAMTPDEYEAMVKRETEEWLKTHGEGSTGKRDRRG